MSRLPLRMPWPAAVAGVAVAVIGVAGLVRGAVPQTAAGGSAVSPVQSPPIVVTGAYVIPPVPPTKEAAAYFTVYNTTAKPDTLVSVQTGAGATAVLHVTVNGSMQVPAGGVVIAAHSHLVLSVGNGHVMIEQLFGTLVPGQNVNIELSFANAGAVNVSAKVIPLGSAPPTGSTSTGATPSGATSATPVPSTSGATK